MPYDKKYDQKWIPYLASGKTPSSKWGQEYKLEFPATKPLAEVEAEQLQLAKELNEAQQQRDAKAYITTKTKQKKAAEAAEIAESQAVLETAQAILRDEDSSYFDYAEAEKRLMAVMAKFPELHTTEGATPQDDPPMQTFKVSPSYFIQDKINPDFMVKELDHQPAMARGSGEMLVWYPRRGSGDYNAEDTRTGDTVPYRNIQDLLARFFIQTHASWGKVSNWREFIIGVTSFDMSQHDGQVPMFDYDAKNVKKLVRKDVKLLQEEYGLGDAWVYETRRGFHVYFFCDVVKQAVYFEMLDKVKCCRGFRKATQEKGYSVLRVSAKYTDFDIKFLYTLPTKNTELKRMTRKAHTIQALLDLGQQCGTHFASMFPKWAHFIQDEGDWKPASKRPTAKRIRKVGLKSDQLIMKNEFTYDNVKPVAKKKNMADSVYGQTATVSWTSGSVSNSTTTNITSAAIGNNDTEDW